MKRILLLITVISCFACYGQETSTIKGQVFDASFFNEPLLMARVTLENTSHATHTNFQGNFELTDVAPGEYNVIVQFLGYDSVHIPVLVPSTGIVHVNTSLQEKTPTFTAMTTEDTSLKEK